MKVYIASPFFNDNEKSVVEQIENVLHDHEFYSPMREGILKEMTPDEKKMRMKDIYYKNIIEIGQSDLVIAVIDNWDTGTVFEIGYAAARDINIISLSTHNYGLNVMIQEAVIAHIHSPDDIIDAILQPNHYRNFSPDVT